MIDLSMIILTFIWNVYNFSPFLLLTLGRLKTLQTFQTFCQLNYSIIILTKKISSGSWSRVWQWIMSACRRDGATCGINIPVFHVPVTICSQVWKPFCWYKYQCDIWYPPSKERRSHHGRAWTPRNNVIKFNIFVLNILYQFHPSLVLT